MSKIILSQPDGPYSCEIDTGAMDVEIRETFLGVHFLAEKGEKLSVSMRDNGFEVRYSGDFGEKGWVTSPVEFKGGIITLHDKEPE